MKEQSYRQQREQLAMDYVENLRNERTMRQNVSYSLIDQEYVLRRKMLRVTRDGRGRR